MSPKSQLDFAQLGAMYDACETMYSYYGGSTDSMHMPIADDMDENREECLRAHRELIYSLFSDLEYSKILDIGCGRGSLAVELNSRFGSDVTGICSSNSELNYANKKINHKSSKFHFSRQDMNQFNWVKPSYYDCIVTVESSCYFQDKSKALDSIHTSLKSGGAWISADIYTQNKSIIYPKSNRMLQDLYTGWKIAPIPNIKAHLNKLSKNFSLASNTELNKSILQYWDGIVPMSNIEFLYKLKFIVRAIEEANHLKDIPLIYKHRLAFMRLIALLRANTITYRVIKAVKN